MVPHASIHQRCTHGNTHQRATGRSGPATGAATAGRPIANRAAPPRGPGSWSRVAQAYSAATEPPAPLPCRDHDAFGAGAAVIVAIRAAGAWQTNPKTPASSVNRAQWFLPCAAGVYHGAGGYRHSDR